MTLFFGLIIIFFLFLVTATLIMLVIGPRLLLEPRRRTEEFYRALGKPVSPKELDLPCEEFDIVTSDGLKLKSWLVVSHGPARGSIIYLHGVADCKIDGLQFAHFMHSQGYNVLLYDSRRHGQSDGHYCTYGYFEKHDVVRAVDYLLTRKNFSVGKVGIFGTSMGAAVGLQAAALDSRISAVVAENSFATLRTIFDDYQRRMIKLSFHYLRNMVIVRSELTAKFKASDVSPLEAVKKIHLPLLFVYGTNDNLINFQYSLLLYEHANIPKELFAVEGASHSNIWDIAGASYRERLREFYDKHLT